MKKVIITIILAVWGYSHSIDKPVIFNLSVGSSKIIGENSDDIKLGLDFEISAFNMYNRNLSMGMGFKFNTWDLDIDVPDVDAYTHLVSFFYQVRYQTFPIGGIYFFYQVSPGVHFGSSYVKYTNKTYTDRHQGVGLNIAGGIVIGKTILMPNFNYMFTGDGNNFKWVGASLGISI